MKKINEVINNEYDNHIMPFLWMHGEEEEILRDYVTKIYESDIKSVCIESRPHEEFLEEKWWKDVSIILDECEKYGMKIWILDDKHFPTGYAAGKIQTEYPELQKLFLDFYQLDLVGPKKNTGTLIKWTTQKRPNFMSVGTEEDVSKQHVKNVVGKIISVVAAPKIDYDKIDDSKLIDVTEHLKGDMLYWDIPEGHWSIFVCFETTEGGEDATSGYLNPLVADATDILIETVYESHYQKYKDKFGYTIEGFFSDEPRFGNVKGSDAVIGRKDMPLPWRPNMLYDFANFLAIDSKELSRKLPLLRMGESEEAKKLRYFYMEYVTELYKENFTKRIGNWCSEHNVKYIGHIIEDNNAHSRLGYGSGHFFKSMAGQDMSGIDVVLHQLLPNQNKGYFKSMTANGWDGEFFHYALAKLGTSLAYLDPKKKGRTMCEVFGAYGWAEGTKLMKWIADHLLVRGVNYFVPHAFTMRSFPDPDCPPHFYAHGENPQFFGFSELMTYINKVSHIFSDGSHCSDVAVLYHAEAEWSGKAMPIQKVTKELTENQVEFDIVSCEMIEQSTVDKNRFSINNQPFKVLIVPYSQYLPQKTLDKLVAFVSQNILVILIDALPSGASEMVDVTETLQKLADTCKVSSLEELGSKITQLDIDQLWTSAYHEDLRYFHYMQDQQSLVMLFNESMLDEIVVHFKLTLDKEYLIYDPWTNGLGNLNRIDDEYIVSLDKGESIILFENKEKINSNSEEGKLSESKITHTLDNQKWDISINGKGIKDTTQYPKTVLTLPILGLGDELEEFSGTISYQTSIEISKEFNRAELKIENANEIVTLYVNSKKVATRISYPYYFDITKYLNIGVNEIQIDVVNSLGRYMRDFLSQYLDFEPLGLIGEVKLNLVNM